MNTTFHSILLLNSLLKDTCGILENCHDGDLCTIDTAQYENNEWICKFEDICEDGLMCDGSDGSCKLQIKLTASNGAVFENFGYQLSISDNVLVVGGLNGEAAYVFEKNAHNSWTQTAKLTADDGASADRFGHSIDIDGNIIIIGARSHNITGAAYIYSRQYGENWTQAAKITASDGKEGGQFGYTVAASEDLVVVGTYSSRDTVYIFENNAGSSNWNETRKLLTTHQYLRDLSISGNVLAVGTLNFVIVYERNTADGSWAQKMTLTKPIGSGGFGNSVSVDGDVMIIGAPYSDGYTGAAYVYEKNQTAWELTANLTADDGSEKDYDYFGLSVGVADGTIVVGAYGDDLSRGSAYTFQKHNGSWTQMNKITADDGESKFFGSSVDINGDIVAVGSYGDDGDKGSVYLNKLLT
jgi:hypothetical protein